MKHLLAISLLAATCLAQAQPATDRLPSASVVVNTISSAESTREGFTRLRLSVTSNEIGTDPAVRIAGISVCSSFVCYESAAPSVSSIVNTANGKSTPITDIEVPYDEIKAVRFKFVGGPSVLHGSVILTNALKLEPGFKGGEIMVVIQRRPNEKSNVSYEPIATAENYIQPEGIAIYYNPAMASTIKLPFATSIAIPAGAYATPKIFIAALHDTGDEFPLLDIYPALASSKPLIVDMTPIKRSSKAQISTQAQSTPSPKVSGPRGSASSQASDLRTPNNLHFEISSTGVIRQPTPAKAIKSPISSSASIDLTAANLQEQTAACNPAGWCNCAVALSVPQNQQIIFDGLTPTGTEYLDWCTTIPPYVHISVSNLADSRERFTIKHDNKITVTNFLALPLQRITSWASNTQAMINGFVWEGNEGTGSGQWGKASGHVHDFSFALGDNLNGGGSCSDLSGFGLPCSSYSAGGNKRVMLVPAVGNGFSWIDNANAEVISNSLSYVSSSTSIVKNGVCTTDNLVSRWSAVGTTSSGRIIFISSTSDGTTTAAELCSVFQALGVSNAIRLDGGPSAAITIDGILKNPLTGLYFVKYGSSRYIPYALKVSYPGW